MITIEIIAIEGNDGSGKGLQTDLLQQKLEADGQRCFVLAFPQYERFFGREIGAMLSGRQAVRADVVDAKSMALWYAMDRWQTFQNVDFSDIDVLLLNRYTLSNVVYQSLRVPAAAQDALANWIFTLEADVLDLPRPDMTILLDVDEKLSQQNVAQKGFRDYVGNQADVYESKEGFLQDVRAAYLRFAQRLEHVYIIESMRDGTMLPPEAIAAAVWEKLKSKR